MTRGASLPGSSTVPRLRPVPHMLELCRRRTMGVAVLARTNPARLSAASSCYGPPCQILFSPLCFPVGTIGGWVGDAWKGRKRVALSIIVGPELTSMNGELGLRATDPPRGTGAAAATAAPGYAVVVSPSPAHSVSMGVLTSTPRGSWAVGITMPETEVMATRKVMRTWKCIVWLDGLGWWWFGAFDRMGNRSNE